MARQIKCYLCGGSDVSLITQKVRFNHEADVYKCKDCELVFLDQDSFSFPKDFYENEYHQTYITHIEPDALNPQVYFEKMKNATKVWADKFSAMLTGKESVLDIGCSTGHFMDLIKEKTSKIYGQELNKKEISFCRDVLNLDVSDRPLNERFKKNTFDYITLIYVLEHISRPKEFLNSLKEFLKPDGKFIILVPNIQDALVNFYNIPEFKNFYYCIEHLFYFNPKTIKELLGQVSLKTEIEIIQEYPLANHLNWAYKHKPSDTLASRKCLPDINISENAKIKGWEDLWVKFNDLYKTFLKSNNFGDRIWCIAGMDEK